ncbi:MAG: hypothetical protein JNK53_04815 [Phycisphaerae bacterium]|nr:hypothetical protein [Phycisphaerae bacterium]
MDIADTECDGLVCPQYGACDEVHADPGCEDPDCCARITRIDALCEGALWDHLCVEKAALLCATVPCTIAVPPGAISEGELCYQTNNDGPNTPNDPRGENAAVLEPQCGDTYEGTCNTGSPRDTDWYRLPGTGRRNIQFTVNAEFPCEVHLVRGVFSGPLQCATTVYGGQCAPVTLQACVTDDGPWYAVVTLGTSVEAIRRGQPCLIEDPENPWPKDYDPVPGFDGARYTVSLACSPCSHPADLNGDGVVNGADLGMLLAAWSLTGPLPEDLNGDGVVGGADLGILLAAWGPVLD